jgi:hypothetical protein
VTGVDVTGERTAELPLPATLAPATEGYVHGSVQAEINRLRAYVFELLARVAERDERIRRLEGAARELCAPALRLEQLLEGP